MEYKISVNLYTPINVPKPAKTDTNLPANKGSENQLNAIEINHMKRGCFESTLEMKSSLGELVIIFEKYKYIASSLDTGIKVNSHNRVNKKTIPIKDKL